MDGYKYDEDLEQKSKCKVLCEEGKAWMSNNKCRKCKKHCLKCKDETLKCQECAKGYVRDKTDKGLCILPAPKFLKVTKKYFKRKTNSVYFKFDKEIDERDWGSLLQVTLEEQQKQPKEVENQPESESKHETADFTYRISRSTDKRQLVISLIFNKGFNHGLLTVHNTSSQNIASIPETEGDTNVYFLNQDTLTFDELTYTIPTAVTKAIDSAKPASKATLTTTSAVAVTTSPGYGVQSIKLYQMFNFLKLINIQWPINFVKFLDIFDTNIFDIILNYL